MITASPTKSVHSYETLEYTELLDRTGTQSGQILHRSHRYCATCQGNNACYVVRWPDGKITKPCVSGCKVNRNGKLQIC